MADDTRQSPADQSAKPPGESTEVPQWASWSSWSTTPAQPAKPSASEALDSPSKPDAIRAPESKSAQQAMSPKREIINEMPGGTANTAGGEKIQDYSFFSILKSIRPNEYQHFHRLPCVRDAILTGIGCGFGAGGLAFVLGRVTWTACTWSIFSFLGSSTGMYEYCQSQIRREKAGMKRAIEVMDAKRLEKDKKMEEVREKRRREKREREDAEEQARVEEERKRRRWYRFW